MQVLCGETAAEKSNMAGKGRALTAAHRCRYDMKMALRFACDMCEYGTIACGMGASSVLPCALVHRRHV